MIPIEDLHFEINFQLNRLNSNWKKHVNVVIIDGYINKAKNILLENYNSIVEKNKTISNRLKSLEIKNYNISDKTKDEKSFIFKLPKDHYNTLSINGLASSVKCDVVDEIFIHNIQTHKINESLRDSNWRPDFNWRETFYNESRSGLHVYHGDVLNVESIYIDYIRNIPDVYYVKGVTYPYTLPNGTVITENVDFDSDDDLLWRKTCDIVIYLIKRDLDDSYKENLETILFSDRVFIN